MNMDEAQIIAKIVAAADGGCPSCASGLCESLNAKFPDFVWTVGEYDENSEFKVTVRLA